MTPSTITFSQRVRIQKKASKRPAPQEIDTRTPSGKSLPY